MILFLVAGLLVCLGIVIFLFVKLEKLCKKLERKKRKGGRWDYLDEFYVD